MNIGTYKRNNPRGFCMRGWDPQNPGTRTLALPVAKDIEGKPEGVQQGMVIATDASGLKWTKGVAAGVTNPIVAFANQDAIDLDVIDADKLTGLQFSGQYRFATPFFSRYAGVTAADVTATEKPAAATVIAYTQGMPLTYAKAGEYTGKMVKGTDGLYHFTAVPAEGYVRPAADGEPVIARVVIESDSVNGKGGLMPLGVNGATTATAAGIPAGVYAGQQSIATAVDSSSIISNSYFLVMDSVMA